MEVLAPVLRSFTEPPALESITVGEPRAGEVRVRMVAAGVCHNCLAVEQGLYPDMPLPMILGDEGADVVDAVGPGCALLPGDHVTLSWAPSCKKCLMCAKHRPALREDASPFYMNDGTSRYSGGDEPVMHFGSSTYSPYVVVAENMAVRITSRVPLDQINESSEALAGKELRGVILFSEDGA
ncbi:alcohol dehydrogenase catalytic domain-containing protein [Phytoactinopolyspora alkaliphila]|nr:alcohol dehydrogenase catalytic domain-containing protein [Phytoactinopolyspora alkaliphila]